MHILYLLWTLIAVHVQGYVQTIIQYQRVLQAVQYLNMEVLTDVPVLRAKPHTLEEIRKELNIYDREALNEMIDNFEDWISKQNHFTKKKFDRRYLETSIVVRKGSLERAKNTLDKLCTLKTLLPHMFSKHNVKEFTDPTGFIIHGTLPTLQDNNYRLYMMKLVSCNFNSDMVLDVLRFVILMSEYAKRTDYCLGFTCVVDCRDVNIYNFLTKINLMELRNGLTILIEGYGFRINGIHLLSSSKSIEILVNILKQLLSEKLVGRIRVHKTIESVYEYVTKDVLPKEYGGQEKPLKEVYNDWVKTLSEEKSVEFLKEFCKPGTNEKLRLSTNYNDQILGMPGSFRTLKLD